KRSEKTAKYGLSPRVSSENLIANQKTKIVSSGLDHSLEEQVMKWRHNEGVLKRPGKWQEFSTCADEIIFRRPPNAERSGRAASTIMGVIQICFERALS